MHLVRTAATILALALCSGGAAASSAGPASYCGMAARTLERAAWADDDRYQDGLQFERSGDVRAALKAYRNAAENGNGLASRKLGDIYGTGRGPVERDYETSLRWYQLTQHDCLSVPKPFIYTGIRR